MLFTGIRVDPDEDAVINVEMNSQAISAGEDIVIVGERPIFDVEESKYYYLIFLRSDCRRPGSKGRTKL